MSPLPMSWRLVVLGLLAIGLDKLRGTRRPLRPLRWLPLPLLHRLADIFGTQRIGYLAFGVRMEKSTQEQAQWAMKVARERGWVDEDGQWRWER